MPWGGRATRAHQRVMLKLTDLQTKIPSYGTV